MPRFVVVYTMKPEDLAAFSARPKSEQEAIDKVVPRLSKVEPKDQAGTRIATGKLATDPKDNKQLIVPLQAPLSAGSFTVNWSVVSVDTHRVNGTYSFKVDR
jgi:methionine-rich copper-binding protein CopC